MSTTVDTTALLASDLTCKGLKTWDTRDGGGYQFNLYHHGKKVAQVTNDGRGGETDIRWPALRWDGSPMPSAKPADVQRQQAAREALNAAVAATPEFEAWGSMLKPDAGILLEELVNHSELVRKCKRWTCFRAADGTEYEIRSPFSPDVAQYVRDTYPGATIHNETLA